MEIKKSELIFLHFYKQNISRMRNALTILFILCIQVCFSQNWVDLVNVYWRASPNNTVENLTENHDLSAISVDLKLPIVLNDSNIIIVGLGQTLNQLSSLKTSAELNEMKFNSAMIQLGWEHKWNQTSKILLMSMTRLNSDYRNISLSHFQQGGLLLGTTKKNANFDWKYGAYYNSEFFGPMIVPIIGFNWKISSEWRLKLAAPVNAEISYSLDKFRTGIKYEGINASYRYEGLGYIDKADNNIWLFAEAHIGKRIWCHIKLGHSILREYNVYRNSEKLDLKVSTAGIGDDREGRLVLGNGLSIEARIIYRLPI